MSFSATRTGLMLGAIASRCDRLVHPAVAPGEERSRQRRLIGVLATGPLLLAATLAVLLPPAVGLTATLASVGALFGGGWLAASLVRLTGRPQPFEASALITGTIAIAAIVASAGGPASPAILAATALPVEAWWIRRTRSAALAGVVAALAVLPVQALLSASFDAAAVNAAQWLVPLAYAAVLCPRLAWTYEEMQSSAKRERGKALENVIDAVVLRITESGDVADASVKARSILGVAPELLLSSGFFDRIHVADRVEYLCALADMREGSGSRRVEVRLRLAAGEGRVGGYRPFAIDLVGSPGSDAPLTAIVRANDEVIALRASLAESTEAAASSEISKSRFLAAVSHELRTPLNAIIGFSDMLLHEMFGGFRDPRQKEYVGLVRDSGNHLLSVVNSILDVSRLEAGAYATNPEPFRFVDAVEMCHSMLKHQAAAKKLAFGVEVSKNAGEILADRRAVQQVLINLVSNAIKFTPEGGNVSIGGKRIGSQLHFWVRDTGIGMSADDLGRIGRPFTQVQNDYTRQFEGTGLGLSLVKGLVALHDGSMSIESEQGGGTVVTVTLPVHGPKTKPAEAGSVVTLEPARPNEENDATLRKTA